MASNAAALYARSGVHATGTDFERMLHAAELRGDERVLDLGTGTAHTALAFAPHVGEAVGLDLTPAMLDQARGLAAEQGVANVRFEHGQAESLPYANDSFDLVTCRVCAHHFADVRAALREAARTYVGLARMGARPRWLDVGGGLGVDYDGSSSTSDSSAAPSCRVCAA